jgi:hypothetical protein
LELGLGFSQWILAGKRSSLLMRIVVMDNASVCVRMKQAANWLDWLR